MQQPSAQPEESGTGAARSVADRFADFLQSRGRRQTRQKSLLLQVVFEQAGHFDAEQLLERLPAAGVAERVSRPTVYRTLSEFVEAGLLRKFELDGRSVYEPEQGSRQCDHLYCVECQRLTEFSNEELAQLRVQIAREHRFQVHSHRLIIRGVCAECRQLRRRTGKPVDRV